MLVHMIPSFRTAQPARQNRRNIDGAGGHGYEIGVRTINPPTLTKERFKGSWTLCPCENDKSAVEAYRAKSVSSLEVPICVDISKADTLFAL